MMLRVPLVKVDAKFRWSKLMLRVPLVKVDAKFPRSKLMPRWSHSAQSVV